MANSRSRKNVPAEEIPAENTPPVENTEEKVMTDTVTPPVDETTDAPTAENSADAATNETKVVEAEKFDIPADPSQLKLSDEFAETFGRKLLETLSDIFDIDKDLKAAAEGDTTSAIVSYAESDVASGTIQAIYGQYSELKANLDNLFAQLTAAVKTEKGDVQLTPDELANKKTLRKTYVDMAKNALQAFQAYAVNNDAAPDVKLFAKTVENMIGGRKTSKSASTGGNVSTEIRPRLNESGGTGGFIEVNGTKFTSFTPAIKEIKKLAGGKDVSVTQVHTAWISAALGDSYRDNSQWSEIPKGNTVTVNVGSEESPINVTIHTEYVAPKTA